MARVPDGSRLVLWNFRHQAFQVAAQRERTLRPAQGFEKLFGRGPEYQEETLTYDVAPLATARLDKDLVPKFGRLDLSVVDARDADRPVAAPDVSIKKSEEKLEPLKKPNPYILPKGDHTVVVTATGFCSGEKKVTITEGETLEEILPLSPELTGDQVARVILDWGKNPRDLDAHLDLANGPDAGPSAHVFFVNKRGVSAAGQVLAELDVDHQDSEGFETVTVYNRTQGTYRYLVHLYAGSGTLGGSQATVEVLTRGDKECARQVYTIPESCTNRWFYVADIELGGSGTSVTARGECLAEPPTSWSTTQKDTEAR